MYTPSTIITSILINTSEQRLRKSTPCISSLYNSIGLRRDWCSHIDSINLPFEDLSYQSIMIWHSSPLHDYDIDHRDKKKHRFNRFLKSMATNGCKPPPPSNFHGTTAQTLHLSSCSMVAEITIFSIQWFEEQEDCFVECALDKG